MDACKSNFFHLKQCHPEQNIRTLRYIGYMNYYLPDPIRFYPVKAQNSWIHTLPRNVSCCLLLWPLGGASVGFPPQTLPHSHAPTGWRCVLFLFYYYYFNVLSARAYVHAHNAVTINTLSNSAWSFHLSCQCVLNSSLSEYDPQTASL